MNVWILNHYATLPDKPGGTRHYDLATELTKRGHHVTIFASGFNHQTKREERLEPRQRYKRQLVNGVDFIWIRTFAYKRNDWRRVVDMVSYTLRVIPLGLRSRGKPDVILASSPHLFAGLAGYVLAKARRAEFVIEIRDLWPQTLVDLGEYSNRSLIVRFLRILEAFLYRRAKKIVILHPKASNYITRLGVPEAKIVHIPNGVNPELFSNPTTELPDALAALISEIRTRGKVLVGYAGAHGIANAMDTIIEAAKLLQDKGGDRAYFLMVGEGPEKERLVARARDLGLRNVAFFGSIPKNTIPKLLMNVDVATLSWKKSPLYQYGMSTNKLWDYMMCARPIVWAIDSANDPVAEAGCGLTVPPEEPDKLANAILEMCHMTDKEREEMGKRGQEYVVKHHSTPILAARLLEAIEEGMRRE